MTKESTKKDRNTVQETASLHEKAVQAVARGDVQPAPRRRRRGPVGPPAASQVRTIVPNQTLLERTCEQFIAEHPPYTRYEIVDQYTAVIR